MSIRLYLQDLGRSIAKVWVGGCDTICPISGDMDPISIVAATSGTADVTFRLGRFIKRTIEAAREVDRDLVHLLGQVENLSSINSGITSITCAFDFVQTFQSSFRDIGSLAKPWQDLWRDTTRISKENNRLLLKLETVLKEIQGLDAANDNLAGRPVEKNLAVAPVRSRMPLRWNLFAILAGILHMAGRRTWRSVPRAPTLCQQQDRKHSHTDKERF